MIRGIFNTLTDPTARRDWRFNMLYTFTRWIMPKYRLQWPEMAWWEDEEFNRYLRRFNLLLGANTDRRWMLHQLTKLAQSVPGDTAECGVLEGASSYLISRAFPDRRHFAFDSFEGLSEPDATDGTRWSAKTMNCTLEKAKENLGDCPNITFLKGWIPERFKEVDNRRFCFVHIDVQLYQPTLDSVTFFYPRLNPGAVLLSDDYGFTTCPGAKRAFDEFLLDKPEKMVWLSCGSAFLIKGLAIENHRPLLTHG